ncbi:CHAT domain-containing protein [Isoptericola halotolerans]|uniref:CHAT domain-containing protein n=1 Tax=Isoptericola halotolerans TaxID=300560 RepID=UPI00388FF786
MTSRADFDTRLREAQELNAASRVRPASRAYRSLLRDVGPLDPRVHGAWVVELRVRSLVGEGSCVYSLTGDVDAAKRLIAEARHVASEADDPALVAVTHGQEGLLHVRSGDAVAAIDAFDRALATAAPDNQRDLAVLHINRAAAALDIGDHGAVVQDLERALRYARAIGNDRYVAFATQNLGWARYRQGDFPAALRELEEAAALQPGGVDGWSELARAQVLLDAGLVTEAERILAGSVPLLAEEGLGAERADALLSRARCALMLKHPADAAGWAEKARRAFERMGNEPWTLQARVAGLEARLAVDRDSGSVRRSTLRRRCEEALAVARTGDDLVAVSHGTALVARLLAAEWALLAGDPEHAAVIVTDTTRQLRRDHPLPLRVHHQSVLAQVAFANGDRRRGLAAVRRGHGVLADHRAGLGSVDVVTAAASYGVRLALVDVEAALATGSARAVLDATERGRATFAGTVRVRPAQDPELAEMLAEARRRAEEARQLVTSQDAADVQEGVRLQREVRRLQELARQRSWQLGGADQELAPRPATARETVARLALAAPGATVVSYLLTETVTAIRVDARGVRLVELCPLRDVTELARRVRQDFDVLANRLIPAPMRQVAAASAHRSLGRLDELLLEPLGVEGPLDVAARGGLLSLPWSSLPSRAGRSTRVHSWVDLREPRSDPGRRGALVVGGPDLESVERESGLVAGEWDDALLLAGAEATCAATTAALPGAAVVHVAAHGVHEPDNPLFSCVRLADGPLYAHELDGVDLSGVVVVLSACEVGRASVRLGGEPLGMTSVLLRLGARAVVAAVAPLRDDVAARVMPRLHVALREGQDPAVALALAVGLEPEPVPLVCFGPLVGSL